MRRWYAEFLPPAQLLGHSSLQVAVPFLKVKPILLEKASSWDSDLYTRRQLRNISDVGPNSLIWLVSFSDNPAHLPEACLLESLSLCLHSYPRSDHKLACYGQDSEQKP